MNAITTDNKQPKLTIEWRPGDVSWVRADKDIGNGIIRSLFIDSTGKTELSYTPEDHDLSRISEPGSPEAMADIIKMHEYLTSSDKAKDHRVIRRVITEPLLAKI